MLDEPGDPDADEPERPRPVAKRTVEQVAREVKPDDWTLFRRVLDETKASPKPSTST